MRELLLEPKSVAPSVSPSVVQTIGASIGTIDQIMMVILENTDLLLSTLSTPYLGSTLPSQGALGKNWFGVEPDPCSCSKPEYVAIAFGDYVIPGCRFRI